MAAPAPTPRVSVIIPVYNDGARLATCLDLLAAQTYPADRVEVVVIDNGSKEDIGAVVQAHLPRARFLKEPTPGSYAARNAGLAVATGEVIAFTDADCQPAPDWLAKGVAALLADPKLGMVAGHVEIFPRDSSHPTGAELFDMSYGIRQDRYVGKEHAAATANVFTRRSVLDQVGVFDATLKSSGDFEWGQRVHAAGFGQVYRRDVVVRHPARPGLRALLRKARRIIGGHVDTGWRDVPWRRRLFLWRKSLRLPNDVKPRARELDAQFGKGAGRRFYWAVYLVRVIKVAEEARILLGGKSMR